MSNYYLIISGGRDFADREAIASVIAQASERHSHLRIVTGGARGADQLAIDIAKELQIPYKVFMAQWKSHGKRAGFIRNDHMVEVLNYWRDRGHGGSVVAFPGGAGTRHMVRAARAAGIIVREVAA